jgi:hypothetical protein
VLQGNLQRMNSIYRRREFERPVGCLAKRRILIVNIPGRILAVLRESMERQVERQGLDDSSGFLTTFGYVFRPFSWNIKTTSNLSLSHKYSLKTLTNWLLISLFPNLGKRCYLHAIEQFKRRVCDQFWNRAQLPPM